jgi:hypothetical protein
MAPILWFVAAAVAAHAQGPDLERAKTVAAEFLGTTVEDTVWLAVRLREGTPSWYNAISVRVPDPPTVAGAEGEGISLYVEPRSYYVCRVGWRERSPLKRPAGADALSLDRTRAIALEFAEKHFSAWSERMRLTSEKTGDSLGREGAVVHDFRWEEWLDGVRTGSSVRCRMNPRPPGTIYHYSAYIAPKWSPDVVKVTREEAERTAIKLLEDGGAEAPWVLEADLFLSAPFMEQPHWRVRLDYASRDGGFLEQLLVDAVTGEELTAQYGRSGSE